jgi:glycosyltransferase involved in cell wall biosynthesis
MQLTQASLKQVNRSAHPNPLLTLLIPTWNNLAYLKLCIQSIRNHSKESMQIIVHVNEGKDGTLEWIEQQLDIDYTYSDINIGVCYPLNYARSLIKGEYVVFLNDDMYALPGWDTALMKEVRSIGHKWFFLSATMIEPTDTGNASVIVANYGTSPDEFKEQELLKEYAALKKPDWMGSTWPPNIVHRDVWDLAGGYSIEYSPGMYSDPDFSMKLWTMGIRLFKGVSLSRVYHFGGKSTGRIVRNKGHYTFIGKWGFTSSWFTKKVLHRGSPFTGTASMPELGLGQKLKLTLKRLGAAMKSR